MFNNLTSRLQQFTRDFLTNKNSDTNNEEEEAEAEDIDDNDDNNNDVQVNSTKQENDNNPRSNTETNNEFVPINLNDSSNKPKILQQNNKTSNSNQVPTTNNSQFLTKLVHKQQEEVTHSFHSFIIYCFLFIYLFLFFADHLKT